MEMLPIKMHNDLACAKYSMNATEQKLFIFAIRNLNQDSENFVVSKFHVSEFAKYADLDLSRLFKEIKSVTESIQKTIIYIQKDNLDKWSSHILAPDCYYDKGEITFKFNDVMKPYLLQMKEHYFLQSPMVSQFKSWYSIRIYDFLKSKSYKNGVVIVSLIDLKIYLALEDKYDRFNNFRTRVLDIAVDEINTSTSDIKVTYELIYSGKSVRDVEFTVERKDNVKPSGLWDIINVNELKLKTGITNGVFSNMQLEKLYNVAVKRFNGYKDDDQLFLYMKMCYDYTKKNKPEIPYGYYKNALSKDYESAITQIKTGYFIEQLKME